MAAAAVVGTKVASLGLGWEIENIRPRIIKYTECTRRRVLLILKLATKKVHLGKHVLPETVSLKLMAQFNCVKLARAAQTLQAQFRFSSVVLLYFVSAFCVRFIILFIWNEW